MFKKVDPKQSFKDLEEGVLKFWREKKIFEKSLEIRKNSPKFTFYDGPPFATGLPHYGHILAMSIKDAVTRYKTMRGYYVPRRNGWDCHGLPVEFEMEKELGISGKKDIEKMGVAKFNESCRSIVFRHIKDWTKTIERMGRWVDLSHTYATMDSDYIESVWWVFSEIYKKGLVYKGFKSMPYCPRCGTPVSNFEVNLGYADVEDISIYIKFPLKDEKDTYLLVWTTTPWTLPGNVAVAISPDATYVKVTKDKKEYLILAKERLSILDKSYGIVEEIKAKDLVGKEYEPLYSFLPFKERAYYIAAADFVSLEDGTGLVHIAPAFGEDDLNLGQRENLPIIQPVDMNGHLIKEAGEFAGMFVKDADPKIIEDLKKRGLLFREEKIFHTYPFCWRCETPLLYYAMTTWFIDVPKVREKLIKNNKEIHWMPRHIKEGRFGKWLEGVREWAISRNRYWGAPIPLWECEKCNNIEVISSLDELKKKSLTKIKEDFDPHKPYIDEVKIKCSKCGGSAQRIPEVFDCWFESGSMPYAQWHYPFENQKVFEENFPADFIGEGLDQTRGWFYTLHVIAAILYNKPAFKNVIVNGILLAADGKKLSKRLRNYPEPEEVFDKYGADSMRFYFFTSNTPLGEDARISSDFFRDVAFRFVDTLRHTYLFFVTYANIDGFNPNDSKWQTKERSLLDKWIISRLNETIKTVTKYFDEYDLPHAARPLEEFVSDLSNWYIRRSRKRFSKTGVDEDKKSAYQTLSYVLIEVSKLLAPLSPFISEEIYQNLVCSVDSKALESVHLADYPKADEKLIDKKLNEEMRLIRDIVTLGLAIRAENKIRVRQPLQELKIKLKGKNLSGTFTMDSTLIKEELNVKKVLINPSPAELKKFSTKESNGLMVGLDLVITNELKKEGLAREIIRQVQDLRKQAELTVKDRIILYWDSKDSEMKKVFEVLRENIASETRSKEINPAAAGKADVFGKDIKVDGKEVWIGLEKIKN